MEKHTLSNNFLDKVLTALVFEIMPEEKMVYVEYVKMTEIIP